MTTRVYAPAACLCLALLSACGRKPCDDPDVNKGPVVRLDVSLETCNFTPVAVPTGPDRVKKREVVQLNGKASTDRNGDSLGFEWTMIDKPDRSQAELDDPKSATPRFVPDRAGRYEIDLRVSDGELTSAVATFTMRVTNEVPIANAGLDFPSPLGAPATLDGNASTDADGDPLTYTWTVKSRPAGSAARLSDPNSATPQLTPDLYGVYLLGLVVNDGDVDSAEDLVRVGGGVVGQPPVANAGADLTAVLGKWTPLNGSASYDPEGTPLLYQWSIAEQPLRSLEMGSFSDPKLATPNFLPAKEGRYQVELVVEDDFFGSAPDRVQVDVVVGTGVLNGPCEPDGCPMFSICQNAICVPRGGCGTKTAAGSDMPETHQFDLGQTSGTFELIYDTYFQEDLIRVLYEGTEIFSSGCVGESKMIRIPYSGSTTTVTVEVEPNCNGGSGTAWEFQVNCPM
ncbi:MAG: hypothetical protein IPG45_25930 [Deltaproteobacteria bacterium]|nr:hypothetical protein [Deltaproteobacteria bacterium]